MTFELADGVVLLAACMGLHCGGKALRTSGARAQNSGLVLGGPAGRT